MDRPRLLKEKCATCVFRPGNPMHLSEGRLADLTEANRSTGSLLICHDTLSYGQHPEAGEAMCRGYWDAYSEGTRVRQIMERLYGPNWYDEVEPPS